MMLTTAEIASMRATAATTFDSTCVIQGGTIVSDSGGGGTLTWTARGTVGCHLSPILARGDREGVEGGRIDADADWVVTVPAETVIEKDDRLVIGGTSYEVAALRAPRTWELTRRVEASEVT